jgi:F-type H+-transporting ATPase subunit epsilon
VAEGTKTFRCTVIAPQGKLLECNATSVIMPSHDGQMGILPGHMPIFCQLGLGPMEVQSAPDAEGKTAGQVFLLIDGGFAMFNSNNLSVTAASGVNVSTTTAEKFELLVERYKADLAAAPAQQHLQAERRLSLLESLRSHLPA